MEEGRCRHCAHTIVLTEARRRSRNYICNGCANRQRDADVARYLARKLADALRRQGHAGPYPGVDFVRTVMARPDKMPRGAGAGETRHLCVVLEDPAAGYTVENARLVPGGASYALSRKRRRMMEQEDR